MDHQQKMIYCFIGTKAQLIKMAPIIAQLRLNNIPYRYIDSGQHAITTQKLRQVFDLPAPDLNLRSTAKDITSTADAISWYVGLFWKSQINRRWLREVVFPQNGICLIHGDTLSTLLGMQMARAAGVRVAHVEAGLRSFHWFDPFPEELIRVFCMKHADLLFAPSANSERNLTAMRLKGKVVRVEGNTVADSLAWIRSKGLLFRDKMTDQFAVATCHRIETIANRHRLRQVIDLLNLVSETMRTVFVIHEPTRAALARFDLFQEMSPRITLNELMEYSDFIPMLMASQIVLTDGGSIQEECAYLGKPCLILRNQTERSDGLGETATLWGFDRGVAKSFLRKFTGATFSPTVALPQPSAQIVDHLVSWA